MSACPYRRDDKCNRGCKGFRCHYREELARECIPKQEVLVISNPRGGKSWVRAMFVEKGATDAVLKAVRQPDMIWCDEVAEIDPANLKVFLTGNWVFTNWDDWKSNRDIA